MNTDIDNSPYRVSRITCHRHGLASKVLAVFAYNEAKTICAALKSILLAAPGEEVSVFVLANGCSDNTTELVRSGAGFIPDLTLVEFDLADKANAWNQFVHDLISDDDAGLVETWFFMDGDVTLGVDAIIRLGDAFEDAPSAVAAGGMPGSGREMELRRRVMVPTGMLAGNFYALRGEFIRNIRHSNIRMPVGLIGDDFFISWLVANVTWPNSSPSRSARCVFIDSAEFFYRSLSPWRLRDYRTYLRRLWRYALRGIQHQMLILVIMQHGLMAIPKSVDELYLYGPLPSRINRNRPLLAPMHLIAMLKIRALRDRTMNGK
ncbi:MAG: glycosyltransferase [Gammaproteobacteria bacterium]|nr:glycosyltransferase [Gammaproteobacteria bacterium]